MLHLVPYLIIGWLVLALGTPACAESPLLLETVPLNRGFTLSAALPRVTSGLDPPQWETTRILTVGRGGQWHSREQYRLQFDQSPIPSGIHQTEPVPDWAKSHSALGVAFQSGSWMAAVEYQRRNRVPLIDRGYFGSSGKVFAGLKYQFDASTSFYAGVSRGVSAGVRWVGRDGDEAAFTFVAQSPNRGIRELFAGSPASDLRNVVALTYRKPF